MENIIVIVIVAVILRTAIRYIIREKKRGKRCIGCSQSGCCGAKESPCQGCSGGCSGKEK